MAGRPAAQGPFGRVTGRTREITREDRQACGAGPRADVLRRASVLGQTLRDVEPALRRTEPAGEGGAGDVGDGRRRPGGRPLPPVSTRPGRGRG
ncbi:hypothetical protein [Streptomyces sp. CoH27]|uniref:hypothetical protein n=1 Tax=Streptomyces sp. CoH27 TaxID=2875763 RepID=UPI001CD3465F|nr:hypothetical protein [Streptomyces sp. CoH27]